MEHILNFLSLPWQEQVLHTTLHHTALQVLHHETMINQPGGVRVSIRERSSDQIIKPINLDALTQWVGTFPEEVLEEMAEVAPMLARLGYDPAANPPHYGVPDGVVTNNTKEVETASPFCSLLLPPSGAQSREGVGGPQSAAHQANEERRLGEEEFSGELNVPS
jgi:hypothetical protein